MKAEFWRCSVRPSRRFFVTRSNAGRWLAQHPDVHGHVISIEDAVASGRAVFSDVLTRT
jgi:hypothetical protein